ncbi:1b506ba3-578c-4ed3-83d7-6270becb2a2b [Sclerotinia trifoliorum]|uniref:1b506ba3-578c-4ed3-83d7-6270becb2a2b n=1 Tax=Sclerotinia trifoliorum TaxID=28548 RepID=A0A8H2ZK09_9HELO|nr:1b506ba3-578c-4ed3-83d7-6270becb2a2b [Sclerotinia trifoliorum]
MAAEKKDTYLDRESMNFIQIFLLEDFENIPHNPYLRDKNRRRDSLNPNLSSPLQGLHESQQLPTALWPVTTMSWYIINCVIGGCLEPSNITAAQGHDQGKLNTSCLGA